MYIYNTSFMVEAPVHDRWLALVRDKYIPFLKKEGFDRITLSRILSSETAGQLTYSLQVRVAEIPEYETIASGLFDGQVLHFATLMKVIEE